MSIRSQLAAVLMQHGASENVGSAEVSDLVGRMKETFEAANERRKEAEEQMENQRRIRIARASTRIVLRWQTGALAAAFTSWCTSADSARNLKRAGTKAVQRWAGGRASAALSAWQGRADQSRALSRTAARAVRRARSRTLSLAWDAWAEPRPAHGPAGAEAGPGCVGGAEWLKEALGAMQEDLDGMLARVEAVERAAEESMSVRFF
jgi:hypothetical protein